MGYVENRRWVSEIGGLGTPRRDRRSGSYGTFIPHTLADRAFILEGEVAADVADAESAVARLDGTAVALTDTEALARLLLRAESVASSRIEGLSISPQRLLRAAARRAQGGEIHDVNASEVLGNIEAMTYATSVNANPITVSSLCEVHRRLLGQTRLAEQAGKLRTQQNWIGGNQYNPFGAAFVPPPPEEVPRLLADLCNFCNGDALPVVAQAAIAHAQFETIHPFADGNGRTGRALIHTILRRRNLTSRTTPPISLVLATRAQDYVSALQATRYIGASNSAEAVSAENRWVAVFAAACTQAVAEAERFEQQVEALQAAWRERLGPTRADAASLALLKSLPAAPIISVRDAMSLVGRSFATLNSAIGSLVTVGILTPTRLGRRNRSFEARELIDAFTDLERQLANPEGNTRLARPIRAVPARPRRS